MLEAAPGLMAVTVLEELQLRYPQRFDGAVLRTLQRRVRQWRAEHGGDREIFFAQEHPPGRLGLSDFTVCDELAITIVGVVLPHRLYQFAFAHSGWRHACIVLGGESFQALASGLQEALWMAGGVPEEHRTDSLSAAFNNLAEQEELTARYRELCASRNNPGVSHENGSIEARQLRRFDAHMDRVHGLAPKTRTQVLRVVGRLLRQRFGGGCVDVASIKPAYLRRFYAQQATLHRKPGGAGSVVAALHSYFRYRASLGDLVHGLIGAVSAPAKWRLATLPKALTAQEVEQLVASLGKPGRSMRRADAIVRRALDLGLRSGQVARLELDDIDWQAGTITLRHTKGLREDVLPLPATTGEAIATYLKNERPHTSNRAVFVRHIAPREVPVGPDLVRKTIRQAYRRAGLPYTRSHLLRHSMATRLLAGGSSLKEVADVLRHRALSTTQVYAKLPPVPPASPCRAGSSGARCRG